MNRYFLVHDLSLPTLADDGQPNPAEFGIYHYIPLDSHGLNGQYWNLLTLQDNNAKPCDAWVAFPSLFDQQTLVADVIPITLLQDLGITGAHTTLSMVFLLSGINPIMGI